MTDQTVEQAEEDDELLLEIQERFTAAARHASKWREEAEECFNFYAGDQWDDDAKQLLIEQQRVPLTFNRTGTLVEAIIGYETNNRQETRYIPRTQGDAKVNEMLTEAANYFRDQCDAEFEESDAFRDMIISGMGWTNDRLTDERNPKYDLVRDRVDPLEMLWDPSSKKPNLDDARYLFRKKWMDRDEAKAILPEWDGQLSPADWISDDFEPDDSADTASGTMVSEKSATRDVPVVEYQYIVNRIDHLVAHPGTGEQLTLSEEEWDQVDEPTKTAVTDGTIPHTTQRKAEWHRCWLIGGEIVKKDAPYPGGATYHCITGKRDRNKGHWFGIVKALMDPQMWSNKALSQIIHLINVSAKPGYDIEQGAIKDMRKFEQNAAKPGAVNVFEDGSLQKQRVIPRQATGLPPDLANLMQYANDSMSDVSGVNQELLGMADREQAGVLEYQRKQSAVTLLAPLFDAFRRYRKIAGRCWLYHMQTYMTDSRIVRITTDDGSPIHVPFQQGPVPMPPQQGQPGQMQQPGMPPQPQQMAQPGQAQQPDPTVIQFFDPEVSEYDVIVDQSSSSPNQKEATYAALQPILPLLIERMGPEEIMLVLEYSPLPESFIEKLKAIQTAKAQQPPPPNPEMMKVQVQQQLGQAKVQQTQQMSAAKIQADQQKAQLDAQNQQEQLLIKKQLAEAQLMLEGQKAQHQAQLEQMKLQNEMQLQHVKVASQIQIDAMKANANAQMASDKTAASIETMNTMAKAKAKAASKAPVKAK